MFNTYGAARPLSKVWYFDMLEMFGASAAYLFFVTEGLETANVCISPDPISILNLLAFPPGPVTSGNFCSTIEWLFKRLPRESSSELKF